MNIDIRLKLDIFEHPKIGKLRRRLGAESVLALLRLWLWAAANRCDGVLRGLDAESVELASQWNGAPGEFVAALCELRLLDRLDFEPPAEGETGGKADKKPAPREVETFCIHDWIEHQAWASRSDERSRNARKAAQERWEKFAEKEEKKIKKNGLCSNMLAASPSSAPRAKNQKPEAIALSSAEAGTKRKSAGAAGQGGAPAEEAKRTALFAGVEPDEAAPQAGPDRAGEKEISFPDERPAQAEAPVGSLADSAGQTALVPELLPASEGPALDGTDQHGSFPAGQALELAQSDNAKIEAVGLSPAPLLPARSSGRAFTPPSFEEVQMYCALRGNGVDARRFVDWCEERQWRVGGERVRDWRALVRRWEKHERARAPAPSALANAPACAAPRFTRLSRAAVEPFPQPAPSAAPGFAGLRAGSVHQELVRERDLMARIILNENRGMYARFPRDAQTSGPPQPALPPEWADGR